MSIRQRLLTNGSFVYDVTVDLGPDPDTGKRRQERKTLPSKREARAYERTRLAEIKAGRATPRVRIPLAAYLATWLDTVIRVRCVDTTQGEYRWQVDKRITPALGTILLTDLTTVRVQRWIADLAARPGVRGHLLSERSVEAAYRVLHMALHDAVRQHLLPDNPADGVTLPKRERTPHKPVWSPEEVARFLAVAQTDGPYEPVWTLAVLTGMRRAELLGLRWSDIDWDAGTASVRQTITARGGPATTKAPKNPSSRRPIPLGPELLALLADHQQRQAAYREYCLDAYEDHDLICANAFGRPWHPSTITHRFKDLVALAGVPELNLHYTRHAYATIALSGGETLKAVSEVLGHSDPQTTIRVYQQVERGAHARVAASVERAIMSHFTQHVTSDVTNKEEASENATAAGGVPLENLVRPEGLEPPTLRSGIWKGPLPTPLASKRRSTRRHAQSSENQEKTEGEAVS